MLLTSENLLENLLCVFPELEDEINDVIGWTGGKYSHLIFGIAFRPYIKEVIICEASNLEKKKDIINFLESMAISDDDAVRAVLIESILEPLLDYPLEFEKIEPYLLEKTVLYLPPLKKFYKYEERRIEALSEEIVIPKKPILTRIKQYFKRC
jgi:hypothetical protein